MQGGLFLKRGERGADVAKFKNPKALACEGGRERAGGKSALKKQRKWVLKRFPAPGEGDIREGGRGEVHKREGRGGGREGRRDSRPPRLHARHGFFT